VTSLILPSPRMWHDQYWSALAISTIYGIPNYDAGFPAGSPLPRVSIDYEIELWPSAAATQVVTKITRWTVDPEGLINIRGLSYASADGEPILPVMHTSRVLPAGSRAVNVTWNQAESESITVANDVPLATTGIHSLAAPGSEPGTFSYDGFYPPTLTLTSTVSTLGGGATEVGLTVVPVQYDASTHQTRIWTKLVFELEYEVDQDALVMDSDGDGLPDYWESGFGLSPFDASGDQGASGDPDGDGLTNAQERALGTDPLNPDTDRDGDRDGLEVDQGTDPLNPGSRLSILYLPLILRDQ
jgi:hypothetical protein